MGLECYLIWETKASGCGACSVAAEELGWVLVCLSILLLGHSLGSSTGPGVSLQTPPTRPEALPRTICSVWFCSTSFHLAALEIENPCLGTSEDSGKDILREQPGIFLNNLALAYDLGQISLFFQSHWPVKVTITFPCRVSEDGTIFMYVRGGLKRWHFSSHQRMQPCDVMWWQREGGRGVPTNRCDFRMLPKGASEYGPSKGRWGSELLLFFGFMYR